MSGSQFTPIARYAEPSHWSSHEDAVTLEQPLEIRVRGTSVAITMRTPGHDAELAVGFAIAEGLITSPKQVVEVAHCRRGEAEHPENIINLYLDGSANVDLEKLSRHVYASSSCGICGKASLEALQQQWPPIESSFSIGTTTLLALPERLHTAQTTFRETGGLHGAALADADGNLLCTREDVGRHNAVDKVIGWRLLNDSNSQVDVLLMVSGRVSFEIMQKALAARIPFVAAVSAPTSLAVEAALANGQTLVGFLRDGGFNSYANAQRIEGAPPLPAEAAKTESGSESTP